MQIVLSTDPPVTLRNPWFNKRIRSLTEAENPGGSRDLVGGETKDTEDDMPEGVECSGGRQSGAARVATGPASKIFSPGDNTY